MTETSPDGSPTPRKQINAKGSPFDNQSGGVHLGKHEHQPTEHPTFGQAPHFNMSGLSLVDKVFVPSGISGKSAMKSTMALPSPHVNPDPTDFLSTASSRFNNTFSADTARSTAPFYSTLPFFHGAADNSEDELTSSIGESASTIETSAESAEVARLRKELFAAQTKLANVGVDVGRDNAKIEVPPRLENAFANQPAGLGGTGSMVRSSISGQSGFGNSEDAFALYNSNFDCNDMLLHGSMPDYTNHPQLPRSAYTGPGVIGQQDHGMRRGHIEPHNSTDRQLPASQELLRRDSFARHPLLKENQPWGYDANTMGGTPMPPSRVDTIGSALGSLPPSLASSTTSLPAMNPHIAALGPRSQSATMLSPMAPDFSSMHGGYNHPTPWNAQPREEPPQRYMTMAETLNYRQMLERNYSGPYKPFVDRIVYSNDQQSSIALQHELKVASPDQKFDVIQAIIDQAQPLMVNRFGNFLVQRCFEHGTPAQIIEISRAIRGHTLNLSMDAFGCHVVQKAFDYAPEEYKALMVHELLCNIPDTVIHRYACHVWQKLFELRWNGDPPMIMKYVNEALRGMWHEVALGETGSLVVQNIFENCKEEDKRPCIQEVLTNIDVIAHGQFGNWCIQHICEHGAPADRTRALDHILHFATDYSIDQYASKVVERCLKLGGPEFLDHYLDRVCEARADRPRMPLIDIAGDQYGNYLIQFILQTADAHRREIVASHLRKHMVSLRGSKYGSRVAMFCNNPGYQPRMNSYGPALDRAPGAGRSGFGQGGPPGPWDQPSRYGRGFDRTFGDRGSDRSFEREFGRGYAGNRFDRFDRGGYDDGY